MHCGNTKCERTKPKSFIGRMISSSEGIVREGRWYCSESCYVNAVLAEYFLRKRCRTELRTSTYPISARSFASALPRGGKVSWSQIEDALEEKSRNGGMPLAHYLAKRGLIDRRDILEALGRHHRVPVASAGARAIDSEVIALVHPDVARLSGVVPLSLERRSKKLSLLMKDPTDLTTQLTIRCLSGVHIQPYQGDPAEIDRLLAQYYPQEQQRPTQPKKELALAR